MILKPALQITKLDIDILIDSGIVENRRLDFKEKLPDNNDNGRKEFLADVVSFANSGGGHIIYGLGEVRDSEGNKTGKPLYVGLKNTGGETERARLDQIIRAGTQPPVPGFQINEVEGFNDGSVIVISIPQSWNSPHMVSFRDASRFYARSNTGRVQMDFTEIRSSFLESERLDERVRAFRADRISRILGDAAPFKLTTKALLVCHWIPVSGLLSNDKMQISRMRSEARGISTNINLTRERFNLDGFVLHSADSDSPDAKTDEYLQVFRSGAYELVTRIQFGNTDNHVLSPFVETLLIKFASSIKNAAAKRAAAPPFLFAASLLNVKNFTLHVERQFSIRPQPPIDREHLMLPEQLIESYDGNTAEILRPTIDALWNALGYESCTHYGRDGKWQQ